MPAPLKEQVADFWSQAACGEDLYLRDESREAYREQSRIRYTLEPYIKEFLEPAKWGGKDVLEIGVGLGADHQLLAEAGARLTGVDLTDRAIEHTATRFRLLGLTSTLRQADAEKLPFEDECFDLVYSWGVIHHSPDIAGAAREILRVLRPGGAFKVMIYHKWSLIGAMLWLRYGLAAGRPFKSLASLYANHLESPGTKAYTKAEAAKLFRGATDLRLKVVLTHGDLLEGEAGQRHKGRLIEISRKVWPRWLLRRVARGNGLFLLIEGRKVR